MPYIDAKARKELGGIESGSYVPGELNFEITQLVTSYLKLNGLGYQTINDVLGALEGAKLEVYRRVAAPYESEKCRLNGDVYPPELVRP